MIAALLGFATIKRIPECYLNFEGTDNYELADFERMSMQSTTSTEFKIAKDKTVKINLIDTYEAYFENPKGETGLTMEIELSENKKFKDYVLAHYKSISKHHINDHGDQLFLESFRIDSTEIFGFTAKSIKNKNLGNYAMFPTDKMAIFFRFMPQENSTINSIEGFKKERDSFIHSYLEHVSECESE